MAGDTKTASVATSNGFYVISHMTTPSDAPALLALGQHLVRFGCGVDGSISAALHVYHKTAWRSPADCGQGSRLRRASSQHGAINAWGALHRMPRQSGAIAPPPTLQGLPQFPPFCRQGLQGLSPPTSYRAWGVTCGAAGVLGANGDTSSMWCIPIHFPYGICEDISSEFGIAVRYALWCERGSSILAIHVAMNK